MIFMFLLLTLAHHLMATVQSFQPIAIPDPWTIVGQYKQATINVEEAGFDEVEHEQAVFDQCDGN